MLKPDLRRCRTISRYFRSSYLASLEWRNDVQETAPVHACIALVQLQQLPLHLRCTSHAGCRYVMLATDRRAALGATRLLHRHPALADCKLGHAVS